MNQFDKQRIANAIWVLEQYRNELYDVMEGIHIGGQWISPSDILYVMEKALNDLECEEETK